MDPVSIALSDGAFPPGSVEVVYAKDQPEYQPLPVIRTPDGQVVSRWRLNEEERAAVAAGADVYLTLYTFNQPLQPIVLMVGAATLGVDLGADEGSKTVILPRPDGEPS